MAEMIGKSKGNARVRIDMTPMVDLAFLLLTFFVLAASLVKPRAQELIYPDKSGDPSPLNEKNAVTILLGKSPAEIAYYMGKWSGADSALHSTTLSASGIRPFLMRKNQEYIHQVAWLQAEADAGRLNEAEFQRQKAFLNENSAPLMVVVKTLPETPYHLVISAMDEINIASIRRRVIQGMTADESEAMSKIRRQR